MSSTRLLIWKKKRKERKRICDFWKLFRDKVFSIEELWILKINRSDLFCGWTMVYSWIISVLWREYEFTINMFPSSPLRKKCPYSELFWSAFSRIRTEYGEIRSIRSKCEKMRARITPNTDTFHAVHLLSDWCLLIGQTIVNKHAAESINCLLTKINLHLSFYKD